MSTPLVSIVIPTYNRLPLLRNTLHSLNVQSYPTTRYEIIVTDDCSTDDTVEFLKESSFNNLKIVTTSKNGGPGPARNRGVAAAEGDLLIFCDSDFIVKDDFINSHVTDHNITPMLALSGMGHWHYVLTYDFGEQWFDFQKEDLKDTLMNSFFSERQAPNLLELEDIYNKKVADFLFCPNWYKSWVQMFEEIIVQYGPDMDGFHYPWISFCTGNVSLTKETFTDLGGFDESFRRREDWEFGYRSFRAGGKFLFSEKAEAYQQLSPINPKRNKTEDTTYVQLCKKYPHFKIHLLSLALKKGFSYQTLSKIFSQHIEKNKESETIIFEKMIRYFATGQFQSLRRWGKKALPVESIHYPEWRQAFDVLRHS